jgi:hypothetical protein
MYHKYSLFLAKIKGLLNNTPQNVNKLGPLLKTLLANSRLQAIFPIIFCSSDHFPIALKGESTKKFFYR